jgi:DNA end-binding protein Ku
MSDAPLVRMATRAMWKGAISFGLVTVPVSLSVAVRPKDVQFHQVHDKDGGRIREKRVCEVDGKEVPYEHVAKGYEVAKGEIVVIGRDELKAVDPVADKTIAVEQFVELPEIDPLYFDRTYFVAPDGKAASHAYALFTAVLEKSGQVAVARIVLSTKQHLCLVRAKDGRLLLTTLAYGDEVAEAPDVPHATPTAQELKMASLLVDQMVGTFEPGKFHDEHRERVIALVKQKAQGRTIAVPEEKAAAPIADLTEALRRSIEEHKGKGAPKGHRRHKKAA